MSHGEAIAFFPPLQKGGWGDLTAVGSHRALGIPFIPPFIKWEAQNNPRYP